MGFQTIRYAMGKTLQLEKDEKEASKAEVVVVVVVVVETREMELFAIEA